LTRHSFEDLWHDAITHKYWHQLHNAAIRRLPSQLHDRAQDVVQRVLLLAWRKRPHVDSPDRLYGWLFVAVKLECKAEIRKARRQVPTVDLDPAALPDTTPSRHAAASGRYRELAAILQEKDDWILELTELQGHTNKQVGEMLGMSEAAVAQRKSRAIKHLREQHAQADGGERR